MLPYWLLFALWAIGAIQTQRRAQNHSILFFVLAAVLTTFMIGLRFAVGGDWGAYQDKYDDIFFLSLPAAMTTTDPGYAATNWLAAQLGFGVWFVNSMCAILFMSGVARLAWRQPNPALAILVAVPYLIIVVAMGYTRQAAAIGIICWVIADASPDRLLRLLMLVGLAALFHKTAILFLPILLVPVITRNPLIGIVGAAIFVLLFTFFLGGESDRLVANYVSNSYDSQGAAIRIAMNVLAAAFLLTFRERMGFDDFIKRFWTICAVLSIVSIGALLVFSASSGVDRLSLFLIPLQIVTLSRLPYVLSRTVAPVPSLLLGVIAYSFAVQFVWLNFADNANSWLPYQTILTSEEA